MRLGFFLVGRFGVMRRLFARTSLRFVVAWRAKSLRLAWRLDAAERAAQFVNLAFVRELLALGDFDEFQHFVELINHLLERFGNLGGVRNGFADGCGFGGTKVNGLDPLALRGRFRTTLRTTVCPAVAGKITLRFTRWPGFGRMEMFGGGMISNRMIGDGLFHGFRLMRGEIGGGFGVRLAEIAGGVAFVRLRVVGGFRRRRGLSGRFGRGRNFFSFGRAGLGGQGARATATTAPAATAAIATGAGSRCGRFQIGMFVRHKFYERMAAGRVNAMSNCGYFFTNRAREAVKPCRKFFSPTGPISPLQKIPATPVGPKCACTSSLS